MKNIIILFSLILLSGSCKKEPGHPRIYITNDKKAAFTEKLNTAEWARSSYEAIKDGVEKYVDRHVTDPEWIISRMQMYWDTHHERIYVIGNEFSHGTGRAPVPTVKFQGNRDWATDYAMPSLEDTQPYMDEKGMYVRNTKKEGQPWEWVHPSKTGRMIGPMNDRIMGLAADAAFLYWYTGEEKYAVFASDIFMTYIRGMHHRREPFALEQYNNSHLMGLATFEVILDAIIPSLAVCYDFLHAYLEKKGEDFEMIASVLKRFADQEIMYGVPDNNWNIFQARFITYLALALESDSHYKDGKGRQYYINEIMNHTTIRQFALKEAVADIFDPETGMWPESATYSMGVCKDMLDIICLIDNAENNRMLDTFAILKKAIPATAEYLFPNGRVTAFGDAKYVPLSAPSFEMLVSLYRKYGDTGREKEATQVLYKLMDDKFYNRKNKSMFSLFFYVDELMDIQPEEVTYDHLTSNMFYAPNTSWLMQRNGKDRKNGMAFSLVGSFGNHAQANGVSLEMYAKGWMLAPESSFGITYSTRDNQEYYARFPAHNTVCVDGISDYPMMRSNHPYELLSCYPEHGDKDPITGNVTFARVAFTEPKTNAKQERLTGMIRTDETTSYLVDIFRSARKDKKDKKHEYFYHSIGQDIDVMNVNGQKITLSPTNELSSDLGDMRGYNYFENKKAVSYGQDFSACFNIRLKEQDNIFVDMWMKGYPGRTVFTAESPKSNAFGRGSVPDELLNQPLPTLIVRQNGEAWERPFVSVFYPYTSGEEKSVRSVGYFGNQKDFTGIIVNSGKRTDYVFSSTGEQQAVVHGDMQFQGDYAVIGVSGQESQLLFLGNGKLLQKDKWRIRAESSPVNISLCKEGVVWKIDASGAVEITIPPDVHPQVTDMADAGRKVDIKTQPDRTSVVKLEKGKYQIK
ncbi:MAG: heparinase II/III-family protein [Bacteroidales bacterium]|nr:heparinase II/III-family protein [Bacteroidales bacterium]